MNVRRIVSLALLLSMSSTATWAEDHPHASASDSPAPASRSIPLDATARDGLPREKAEFNAHGQRHACEGVALIAVLRRAGAMSAEPLRGADLAHRVEAVARDGYRVTFSLAELDPSLGNRRVLLADRCDGQALSPADGPLRLVVPEDARPARSLRQLDTLTVLSP